jgi:hypothetical protein
MKNKWNAVALGGLLALNFLMTKPVRADEWNKKMEFQFSVPVEIERGIVEVFSEDSTGNESLIATILAIPDRTLNTPDHPIHFEERSPEGPEAVHSWFYPGENTGWRFVYPRR